MPWTTQRRMASWAGALLLAVSQVAVVAAQTDAPSLNTSPGSSLARSGNAPTGLPSGAGQIWREYDLRPYTKELNSVDRPHQAIVDWVLRETGTDAWFTDPFGFINADRDTLRVYHNKQMQDVVARVHERFVNGTMQPQLYGLRIMAVGNPNWRTRAHGLMKSVQAQSPGVQAYLLSKENAALLMSLLRGRGDFREISAVDMVVHNGQSQVLQQVRGRNFVQDFEPAAGAWPPFMPKTGEIQEGYQMQLSPLLSLDRSTVDLVIKCNIDQVERLAKVNLELPVGGGQLFNGQINVPQVASWRLHERFRWPSDQVLLLSCGVVAAPQGTTNASLLGQGASILGIDRLISKTGDRADALLMVEYRGDATSRAAPAPTSTASRPLNPLSRGRY